jgi:site-specific recombinase XerD
MEDSTFWFGGMGEGDVSDVSSFGEVVAARLVPSSVVHLHPEDAVFEAMLRGWRAQMMARALAVGTIESRLSTIRRFMEFASEYPWQWQPSDVDDWSAHMRQPGGVSHSTLRAYQGHVRQFCDYLVDGRYGWGQECLDRFGSHPAQVCHEWNTVPHVLEMEAQPGVRPLTRLEVQMLFDYADDRVEQAQRLGRKGWLATWRDATMFKVIYAFGLRRREVAMLETVDFQSNPQAPEFGRFGICNVRWGKSMKGSPPRRRSVLAVMSWSTQVLQEYLEQVRPHYETGPEATLWPTERGGRVSVDYVSHRFAEYRDALGLSSSLHPHCLRHSYVTHLVEDGYDPFFVQQQVGHSWGATTALYTGVSGDFKNKSLRAALDRIAGLGSVST